MLQSLDEVFPPHPGASRATVKKPKNTFKTTSIESLKGNKLKINNQVKLCKITFLTENRIYSTPPPTYSKSDNGIENL